MKSNVDCTKTYAIVTNCKNAGKELCEVRTLRQAINYCYYKAYYTEKIDPQDMISIWVNKDVTKKINLHI